MKYTIIEAHNIIANTPKEYNKRSVLDFEHIVVGYFEDEKTKNRFYAYVIADDCFRLVLTDVKCSIIAQGEKPF